MKKLSYVILISIIGLNGIVACSYRHQPKGYVCVEKSPIKITYMDYHKDITPNTVNNLVRQARAVPYKDCMVNERSEVSVTYSGEAIHSSSASTNLNID